MTGIFGNFLSVLFGFGFPNQFCQAGNNAPCPGWNDILIK